MRIWPTALTMVGALTVLTACGSAGETASGDTGTTLEDMDEIVLTVSDPNPDTASNAQALTQWMDYVTEETDGKVTFETYFSGTLHDGTDALSALDQDLTDITFYYPGFFADQLPVANWVQEDFASAGAAGFPHSGLANTPASQILYESSEDIRNELAEFNAVPLAVWGGSTPSLLCTKPVDSLDSANGTMTNVGGRQWGDEVDALGMTGEFIEIPEEFEALQRGVVDCLKGTVSPLMTSGAWEVADHYTPVEFSPGLTTGYVFNKRTWGELPLEVQQIIHDGKQIILSNFNKTAHERYAEFAEEAPSQGIEFHDPTELNEVLTSYSEETAATVADSAPDSVTAPQEVFDSFSSHMDEWTSILVTDLGIEQVDATGDNTEELYLSARDIDWDSYESAIRETLEEYRPE